MQYKNLLVVLISQYSHIIISAKVVVLLLLRNLSSKNLQGSPSVPIFAYIIVGEILIKHFLLQVILVINIILINTIY